MERSRQELRDLGLLEGIERDPAVDAEAQRQCVRERARRKR